MPTTNPKYNKEPFLPKNVGSYSQVQTSLYLPLFPQYLALFTLGRGNS